jgi:hypothetical protein
MSGTQAATPAYDRSYYLRYLDPDGKLQYARTEHWLSFFGYMAERIATDIRPASALDAGCAMGMLVESLRDRGVEAFGVDISEYAVGNARDDVRPYCVQGSVTEPFPRRYELITCIETLEHLPPNDGERAVANLCAHTDDVIFSSTPSHFKEATHLNVRPPEYWAELFGRHGLYRDVDYDPGTYIAPWAVRFRRRTDPAARIAGDYERLLWRLKSENNGLRELGVERQAELTEVAVRLEAAETGQAAARSELERVRSSRTWHLADRLARMSRRIVPPGGRLRALVRRLAVARGLRGA